MYQGRKCIAVVVSGGRGERFGGDTPKQYLEIGGKPLLVYCLQSFEECEWVDQIRIVANIRYVEYCVQLAKAYGISKLSKVAVGGTTRQESVFAGISDVGDDDIILIHDGVRPFVNVLLIVELISQAALGAAILATPVTDTIKIAKGRLIQHTPDRESLYAAQTPQGFLGDIIKKAHIAARSEGYAGSDDASLVERIGIACSIIPSDSNNIKITTQNDFDFARFVIESKKRCNYDNI